MRLPFFRHRARLSSPRQNAILRVNELESRDHPNATPHSLLTGPLTQNWSNISLITADNNWSAVPSIQGFRGDNLTTGVGVDPRTILADGSGTPINVLANRTNTNLVTGGVGEFHLANPVVGLQGSDVADAPHLVLYLNASNVSGVRVSFKLRDIDGSANNAVQPVAVQYRVGASGNWTNVPGGYVADATAGPGVQGGEIPVNVVLPSNADDKGLVQVRILTTNAVGNDEWVGIDDIVVSRDHTINKWTGSGLFSTATNWSLGRAPVVNDVVVFDGSASNATCTYDSTSSASSFAYVRLVNSFSGTLRLQSAMTVGTVELATGTIDQPTASPFTIGNLFTWTGGTLNSTATLASVYFNGGSMANITPGAGNTLSTGSTLVFGPATALAPTVAAFNPGIIEFRNNAGIDINAFCVADVKPRTGASITFKTANGEPAENGQRIELKADGIMSIVGEDDFTQQRALATSRLPVLIEGGTLQVSKNAEAFIQGRWNPSEKTSGSIRLNSGNVYLENGSRLRTQNGLVVAGGTLKSLDTGTKGAGTTSTIVGPVNNIGGRITIGGANTFTTLEIQGSLFWSSGIYDPDVNAADNTGAAADLLHVTESIEVGNDAQIAPFGANPPPAGIPTGVIWNVVRADTGIMGTASVIGGWQLVAEVPPPNTPVRKWYVKKT